MIRDDDLATFFNACYSLIQTQFIIITPCFQLKATQLLFYAAYDRIGSQTVAFS